MESDNSAEVQAWLKAERDAVKAELAVAGADVQVNEDERVKMYAKARALRATADQLFHVIYQATKRTKRS